MLALVAPGQGAQSPGFLAPWLELPGLSDRLRWWSAVIGIDLIAAGTTWDAARIRDTAIAQPLIVAAGLAAAEVLLEGSDGAVGIAAGHSVGEFTATAAAGGLSAEGALVLVRERGRLMAGAAAAAEPSGMSALLGGDPKIVVPHVESFGLTIANNNGAGQFVAAGSLTALQKLTENPPEGSRVRPLEVAGAFHTEFMRPAVGELEQLVAGVPIRDPHVRLLSNADGKVVTSGPELLRRLVAQVAAPVRWDLCMKTLGQLGVTAVIELPPAGTLTGLIKRALPDIERVALKTPDDLDAARGLLTAHEMSHEPAPAWRVVVAPSAGIFTSSVPEGTEVAPGAVIGELVNRDKRESVTTPNGGVVIEWLLVDGDPVSPGQPLVRLHPTEASS
ncbi:MAG: [acyl-carrier-protein] S-malonyltransferase [Frankiaceae bacterium]|nr:[acyl-carrier-protein] S-malonyltransferase [Frankiaceae bacterium]